ncbi:MAG: hypothetical protein NT118_14070, partial [Lentisphaerae bacterium]|nr:hypothetical protein [Lentisphaerota bacterium]
RRIRNSEILNLKKIPWIKGIGISRSESQNLMNTLTIRVDKETHRSAVATCPAKLAERRRELPLFFRHAQIASSFAKATGDRSQS